MKRTISLLLVLCTLVTCFATPASAASGYYGGAACYYIGFSEVESGGWWIFKTSWINYYSGLATYSSSFIVMLENLSGTISWENYNNKQATVQEMKMGISKQITVSEEKSWTVSANVGFEVPVKAAKISGAIGGSAVRSKTYEKTTETSSAYTLDTRSKNGYYAITHAANCDAYSVKLNFQSGKDASQNCTITGKLIRFSSPNGYERLWYSKNSF